MTEIFLNKIEDRFPNWQEHLSGDALTQLKNTPLVAPFTLRLPKNIQNQAQDFVSDLLKLRQEPQYLKAVAERESLVEHKGLGLCLSCDFHIQEVENKKQLKLIEVNTNAAFLALSEFLYLAHNVENPYAFSLEQFLGQIKEEYQRSEVMDDLSTIVIMDESPQEQKLYLEFLVVREFLLSRGFTVFILDPKDLNISSEGVFFNGKKVNFIYNRSTDFLLQENKLYTKLLPHLKSKNICLSPDPFSYMAIADKELLSIWPKNYADYFSSSSHQCFLKSQNFSFDLKDQFWNQRKRLFFKPAQSFASKTSFRGESISRKLFDEIFSEQMIAQEFCPAPRVQDYIGEYPMMEELRDLKFDLRFYFYSAGIQNVVARVYEGQVTNLRSPRGGFCPVVFV